MKHKTNFTQKNKLLLIHINNFVKYCNEFYNIDGGIYPIATTKEIEEAIKVFLLLEDKKHIDFDTIDREKVRIILNK